MKENKENLKTKKNGGFSDHVYQKATDFNFFTDFQLIFQVDGITNCISLFYKEVPCSIFIAFVTLKTE